MPDTHRPLPHPPLPHRPLRPDRVTATGSEGARHAVQEATIRAQAAALARRDRALEHLEAGAGVGLWSCRLRDAALDWSGGVYDLFGIPRGTALYRPRVVALYEPASRRLLETLRPRALAAGRGFSVETEIVTPRGDSRWIRIWAAVEAEGGRAVRLHGTKQDVSGEMRRLAALSRHAERDPLTALPNRRAFERWCQAPEPTGALLLIDLDGFKAVNDTHGHAAGDACLREAAARLARACRNTDLVARIGGDEFAVLVPPPAPPQGLAALGRRIVEALGRPMDLGGTPARVGASVGIARVGGVRAPGTLFARADAALYAAKAAGRNAVRIDGA